MNRFLTKSSELLFKGFATFVLVWVIFAVIFDLFFIYLHFTNPSLSRYYLDVIMNTLYEL